ncbi:MAG: DUF2231 domain-containing protein [Phycisphaerae bacterium]|jgi:uncharacterized membrane protein
MTFGKLHLLVLHFPLALILAAGLADALSLRWRGGFFRQAALYCLALGALAAIPTVITGSLLLDSLNLTGDAAGLGETHEGLGIAALCVALSALGLRVFRRNNLSGLWAIGYAAMIIGAVALVGLAGHWGGLLAFGRDYL